MALMRDSLGADVWDERIVILLRQHSYSNLNTQNLIDAMKNGTDSFDMGEFVDSWTTQDSGPIVTIVRDYAKNEMANTMNVKMKTFSPITITQESLTSRENNNSWTVRVKLNYLDIESNLRVTRDIWMPRLTKTITVTDIPANEDSFIVALNDQLTIHDYDDGNWQMIIGALRLNSSLFRVDEKMAFVKFNCDPAITSRVSSNYDEKGQLREEVREREAQRAYRCLEIIHWMKEDRDLEHVIDYNLLGDPGFLPGNLVKLIPLCKSVALRKAIRRFLGTYIVAQARAIPHKTFPRASLFPVSYEHFYPNGTVSLVRELTGLRKVLRKSGRYKKYLAIDEKYFFLDDVTSQNATFRSDKEEPIYDLNERFIVEYKTTMAYLKIKPLQCAMERYNQEDIDDDDAGDEGINAYKNIVRNYHYVQYMLLPKEKIKPRLLALEPLLCTQNVEKMKWFVKDLFDVWIQLEKLKDKMEEEEERKGRAEDKAEDLEKIEEEEVKAGSEEDEFGKLEGQKKEREEMKENEKNMTIVSQYYYYYYYYYYSQKTKEEMETDELSESEEFKLVEFVDEVTDEDGDFPGSELDHFGIPTMVLTNSLAFNTIVDYLREHSNELKDHEFVRG